MVFLDKKTLIASKNLQWPTNALLLPGLTLQLPKSGVQILENGRENVHKVKTTRR